MTIGRSGAVTVARFEWDDETSGGLPLTESLSILAPVLPVGDASGVAEDGVLVDLKLDQVIDELTAGAEDPESLRHLFSTPLGGVDAVRYRQRVFADLEHDAVLDGFRSFAQEMGRLRRRSATAAKVTDRPTWGALILDEVGSYCEALQSLDRCLEAAPLSSDALCRFRRFVRSYVDSAGFVALCDEARAVRAALDAVRYCVRVRGLRVEVARYEGEGDYSAEVEASFERFAQGDTRQYGIRYRAEPALGHVGVQILALVARLFPEEFGALDRLAVAHAGFVDPVFEQVRQELAFYLSYLDVLEPLRPAGLRWCLPEIEDGVGLGGHGEEAYDIYDLALALKLTRERRAVVPNDFVLGPGERVVVVSGPNQGGKTTLSRAVGQLHFLASLGCPVPGSAARLFLPDRIFTHFAREESRSATGGRLEDDVVRAGCILEAASAASLIVMNEPFSSTALEDARFLGREAIERVLERDATCVYVTFVDELSRLDPRVASMVSTVSGEDPSQRTLKVVRAPADGLAYAEALAAREGVTYDQLRRRIRR